MKYQFNAHTPSQGTDKWHELQAHLNKVAKLAEEFANKFNAGELVQSGTNNHMIKRELF
jgi:hypothetical protein